MLSDEVERNHLPVGFIEEYTRSVCIRTAEKAPHTPSIFSLDYGALVQLCVDMQVQPPESDEL